MFHLNSSLHCESDTWNTNFARTFLRISDDQLEKLNKIPGWSKTENSEKVTAENDKTVENTESHLAQKDSTATENLPTTKTIISEKNVLILQNHISDLQLKPISITPSTENEAFLENISLSPIKKKYTSVYSLQRSTSLPDLYEKLLSPRKSAEINRKRVHSIEKGISSIEVPPLLTKDLNETYTVPVAFNEGTNHNKLLKINSLKSASCPLEYPKGKFSKQKKLKTLDDGNLNSVEKSIPVSLPSDDTVKIPSQQEMSLLEKKVLLLEKRFSLSKEMSKQPFTTNVLNVENLNGKKNLNSSQTPVPVDQVVTAVLRSDAAEIFDEKQTSSLSKSHEPLELHSNSQLLNEKCVASENTFESVQGSIGNPPKTTGCNFESFLSPPVPCGQLTQTDVPTLSQPISSQQSIKLTTPKKSQIADSPVTFEQPSPTKVLTPVQSQKLTKAIMPNELQTAELSGKIVIPEKPSDTFSVFSANLNENVADSASGKELGAKRKRKHRSEKSSKKLDVKKLKKTDIQFSSAQIKNMIEILKIFHIEY